jgi:hypothetical protein
MSRSAIRSIAPCGVSWHIGEEHITLAGLAVNALFHLPWFDSMAALAAIPILVQEGRSAWHGHAFEGC